MNRTLFVGLCLIIPIFAFFALSVGTLLGDLTASTTTTKTRVTTTRTSPTEMHHNQSLASLTPVSTGNTSSVDEALWSPTRMRARSDKESMDGTVQTNVTSPILPTTIIANSSSHDNAQADNDELLLLCEAKPMGEQQTWNPYKKVISFTLYLQEPTDTIPEWLLGGLKANVRDAKLYYPDWVIRVYTQNLSPNQIKEILQLDETRVEVVCCHVKFLDETIDKRVSRFLAVDDPTVALTLVRDLDSRFSPRELLAVNEWISSDQYFHVMRDHAHHETSIMAGMFGMKRGLFDHYNNLLAQYNKKKKNEPAKRNVTMTSLIHDAVKNKDKRRTSDGNMSDQTFLYYYVWPLVKSRTLAHDSDLERCKERFMGPSCRPWPLLDGDEDSTDFYVGYAFKNGTENTHYSCQLSCQGSEEVVG